MCAWQHLQRPLCDNAIARYILFQIRIARNRLRGFLMPKLSISLSSVLAVLATVTALCSSAYVQSEQALQIKLNHNLAAADQQVRGSQSGGAGGAQTPLIDHGGAVL